MKSYLDHLSSAATALLLADSVLAPCAVLEERKGLIEGDINNALAGLLTRPGRTESGITLVVKAPEVRDNTSEGPAPLLRAQLTIRVIENPEVNAETSRGTGLSAAVCAERVLLLLNLWRHAGLSGSVLECTDKAIQSIETPGGAIAYDVVFHSLYVLQGTQRVATPGLVLMAEGTPLELISETGEPLTLDLSSPPTVALLCATPGASIHYTWALDALPPLPSAEEPLSEYTGPVTLPTIPPGHSLTFLAMAYHPHLLPSCCAEVTLSRPL